MPPHIVSTHAHQIVACCYPGLFFRPPPGSAPRGDGKKGEFRDWTIPAYIKTSLAREYGTLPKEELYVISDVKGEIKFKVEFGRGQKFLDSATKKWRRFTNFKS